MIVTSAKINTGHFFAIPGAGCGHFSTTSALLSAASAGKKYQLLRLKKRSARQCSFSAANGNWLVIKSAISGGVKPILSVRERSDAGLKSTFISICGSRSTKKPAVSHGATVDLRRGAKPAFAYSDTA